MQLFGCKINLFAYLQLYGCIKHSNFMETTTSSNVKAATFSGMFQFQGTIYDNAQANLTEAQAMQRPTEHNNHMNWLLGHVLHCRYMLANMLGVQAENPFGQRYWTEIEDGEYPTVAEVVQHFPAISKQLTEALNGLSDAQLDARAAEDKPSLTEIVSFFVYHEAYHLGQLGYARKALGMDAMKAN